MEGEQQKDRGTDCVVESVEEEQSGFRVDIEVLSRLLDSTPCRSATLQTDGQDRQPKGAAHLFQLNISL